MQAKDPVPLRIITRTIITRNIESGVIIISRMRKVGKDLSVLAHTHTFMPVSHTYAVG